MRMRRRWELQAGNRFGGCGMQGAGKDDERGYAQEGGMCVGGGGGL
jgi:hypothetical protein